VTERVESGPSGPEAQLSLQERYAPDSICFGCGPANRAGLHIRSFVEGDEFVAEWIPSPEHQAFEGVLNGGIIGTLLDCHSNWTAASHLMQRRGVERPPTTVTSEYSIRLLRPTPADRLLHLRARVVESTDERATVEATLEADGEACDSCRGIFVAVRPGHPAYDRW
jgi:acyl-coenzyme A thioesterase PaaI-like protein